MTATEVVNAVKISRVWRALGGSDPVHGRARGFYRDGDNPQAVALDDEKGCWFDHRDGIGGGVLDLIIRTRGGTRADALNWLADLIRVQLVDRPPQPRVIDAALRVRQEANQFASAVRIMSEAVLESLPVETDERMTYTAVVADLRTAPMAKYLDWRDREPEVTAGLVEWGRQRDRRLQISLARFLMTEVANAS